MMNRPFYELRPYLYLGFGIYFLLTFPSTLAQLAAGLLFLAGALVYSLRSSNRRTDPERRRKTGLWPHWVYELLPFIWMVVALQLFSRTPDRNQLLLGAAMMSWSLYLLGRRSLHRHHQRA